MPQTKLKGLEIVIDENYLPEIKVQLKKEDDVEDTKIFLFDEEEKAFDALVHVKHISEDRCYLKEERNVEEDRENFDTEELETVVCDVCGENVPKAENSLKSHQEICQDEVVNLQHCCSDCDFVSTSLQAMKSHNKSAHGAQIYFCRICDYKHSVRNRVSFHEAEKHGDKNIKCHLCDFRCASNRGLNRHMYRKHRPNATIKKFKCDQCEHESAQSSDLTKHKQARHDTITYQCNYCAYVGPNVRSLGRHLKKHEGNSFKCSKCEYTNLTEEQLKVHYKNNHCEKDQLFRCEHCEFVCPTMWRISRHREKHNSGHGQNQTYKCELCDFEAITKSKLASHKACRHTTYLCFICKKEESSRYLITKHVEACHGALVEPANCDQCAFTGCNKRSLQYHMRSKHGSRVFSCKQCAYSAPTSEQLRNHTENKHGRLMKCEYCEVSCPTKWRLRQHTERRHLRNRINNNETKKALKNNNVKKKVMKPLKVENQETIEVVQLEDQELQLAMDYVMKAGQENSDVYITLVNDALMT